jgi:hypothetical protein
MTTVVMVRVLLNLFLLKKYYDLFGKGVCVVDWPCGFAG